MKQKNEIQSIKSSTKNIVIETTSPKIHRKSIESNNDNLYSLDELSISTLTDLSSNDSITFTGLVVIDNSSMSGSNVDMCKFK